MNWIHLIFVRTYWERRKKTTCKITCLRKLFLLWTSLYSVLCLLTTNSSSTRKSCKYCRFKKCLHAKMQISWVLSEPERERRFNKLKKSSYRNNLTSDSPDLSSNLVMLASPLHKSPEINFTIEEQLRLENLRDYVKAMAVPRYERRVPI